MVLNPNKLVVFKIIVDGVKRCNLLTYQTAVITYVYASCIMYDIIILIVNNNIYKL